ncbi:class IIc cyclic bacteriocin [Anaerococcus sp. AGMB00486]|uniref:Class IIc cyclic bacteriocin n=1 Tax=Anaerococcus faecalis TaxID=2742993 RepID=A0ABX2N9F2_9FIRM|nr:MULTISPECIES: class IIc cyclic bacteriocin [Anaerococcus]MDY3006530.1 class IIc cyclic bacteriocin [Anaerococcus porci]NVF11189.1 class IIc cyclic bacteriocin [Anaerococcus faecalis]
MENKKTKKYINCVIFIASLLLVIGVFGNEIIWAGRLMGFDISHSLADDLAEVVSNGGTLASAFAIIMGITMPTWIVGVVAGASTYSA